MLGILAMFSPFKLCASVALNGNIGRSVSRTLNIASTRLSSTTVQSFESGGYVGVVSSCSRGIGLEFTRQLLSNSAMDRVIGLARGNNEAIMQLQAEYPERLMIVNADLQDQTSVVRSGQEIRECVDRVDLLVNSAGILGSGEEGEGPERSLMNIDRDWFSKTLDINLIGHVMMTQQLYPLLKNSGRLLKSQKSSAKIINISARVGSISDNGLGGWYSYRMSKSALNMFTKTLSLEAKRDNIAVASFHPGTTDTDLSKPFQKSVRPEKLFSVEFSVRSMLSHTYQLDLAKSGRFFAYDGQEIPF